ncbi:unnamed protein product [Anisakis simplex]|uniref:Histone-lysine N-methyltransferase n=1 Tax=Anisakis simplex TaxID=6269 RepID=A0A0M3K7B3_ANISI|nr:unnamed protein product [Anisakis simplex]
MDSDSSRRWPGKHNSVTLPKKETGLILGVGYDDVIESHQPAEPRTAKMSTGKKRQDEVVSNGEFFGDQLWQSPVDMIELGVETEEYNKAKNADNCGNGRSSELLQDCSYRHCVDEKNDEINLAVHMQKTSNSCVGDPVQDEEGSESSTGVKSLTEEKKVTSDSESDEAPDLSHGYDENGMYEVERILAKRTQDQWGRPEVQYYVKWKDWPYKTCTWETKRSFGDWAEVRTEFNRRYHALQVVTRKPTYLQNHLRQLHSLARWEHSINTILTQNSREILYIHNDVDAERARHDFTYILKNKYPSELTMFLKEVNTSVSCNCGSDCGDIDKCCPRREGSKFYYKRRNGIKNEFYTCADRRVSAKIVECNDACSCDQSCPTKVVQRGRTQKVAIVRRKTCGWGVVTLEPILESTFVVEYVGEVLSIEEARSRHDSTYHFEMDGGDEVKYVIDAKHFGNEAAFINHSCDPNLDAVCVYVERIDPALHRIALFSNRRIEKGEELTLNYFRGREDEMKSRTSTSSGLRRRCECGAKNCMKYWPTVETDSDDENS